MGGSFQPKTTVREDDDDDDDDDGSGGGDDGDDVDMIKFLSRLSLSLSLAILLASSNINPHGPPSIPRPNINQQREQS